MAWASIVTAAVLPLRGLDASSLKWVGSASILLLGLTLVGVPVPGWAPLAVLLAGLAAAVVASLVANARSARRQDQPDPQPQP